MLKEYKKAVLEDAGKIDLESVDPQLLADLTTNERRELIGYPPLKDDQADEQLLAERLGVGGTDALVSVLTNESLSKDSKRNILMILFNFTDEQATKAVE